jgi:Predicted transcription factor, homolog of eukaryotic MBF1
MSKFGERLRIARKRKGYKQKELASKINVSSQNYNHYERSRYEPSLETLSLICQILEVSADWLLGNNEKYSQGLVNIDSFNDIELVPIMHNISYKNNKIYGELKGHITKTAFQKTNYQLATQSTDNSMLPYFKKGDIVLVDITKKAPIENHFYLIDYEETNFIRKAKLSNKNFTFTSSNLGVNVDDESKIIGEIIGNFTLFDNK